MLNTPLVQVQWSGDSMDSPHMSMEADRYIVESRYGQLTFEPAQVVTLGRPVLGFPHLSQFGLTKLAGQGEQAANFVLLQSLEDAGVSFPTVALDLKNTLIAEADIMAVYTELGITPQDGAVLCILTVREENGKDIITANLRAPVFIDTAKKQGWQVVLNNSAYQIRQQI
jgi:flagellar assembly factor FliW